MLQPWPPPRGTHGPAHGVGACWGARPCAAGPIGLSRSPERGWDPGRALGESFFLCWRSPAQMTTEAGAKLPIFSPHPLPRSHLLQSRARPPLSTSVSPGWQGVFSQGERCPRGHGLSLTLIQHRWQSCWRTAALSAHTQLPQSSP